MKQKDANIYIEFFERFFMLYTKWSVKPNNIYNMDESGCCIGLHQKSQVIVPANEMEAVAIFAINGNREWATLVETIRVFGTDDIPAFLIYKSVFILDELVYDTNMVLWCSKNR